ncbi:sensor histidine kinase [Pedobacter gandavensis]|uniref:Histidine kinase n=1 Tax=Pedobacter gandavensis TaxID=2679963 RepID=A0ABR6EQH4_9SPHI|nr:histidine kinase [Pedobacter gandavensis]MBB2147499.1 histidine kinase [Pedobacter gandavensis]
MLKKYSTYQLLFISLIAALFVIYPDITWLPFELKKMSDSAKANYISFFLLRYSFLAGLIFLLIKINLLHIKTVDFKKRFVYNTIISIVAFAIYGGMSFLMYTRLKHYGSLVLFQFFIVSILGTLMGHIVTLYNEQRKREQEIEELKVKNLQSRYDALTNQINPHFFFNSLNGLTALIRKKSNEETLTYVNKLSDVFRYILQSDKKGLVTLGEELNFVDAFRYMMEVRFANKLEYHVNIDPQALSKKLPVLSILPLLDNIVVHNMIDSDHKMIINIYINENNELVVSNPIYPKLSPAVTNGTGLNNLEGRFLLLMEKQIKVENNGRVFNVYLPLG